jgi:hypothetical protein
MDGRVSAVALEVAFASTKPSEPESLKVTEGWFYFLPYRILAIVYRVSRLVSGVSYIVARVSSVSCLVSRVWSVSWLVARVWSAPWLVYRVSCVVYRASSVLWRVSCMSGAGRRLARVADRIWLRRYTRGTTCDEFGSAVAGWGSEGGAACSGIAPTSRHSPAHGLEVPGGTQGRAGG